MVIFHSYVSLPEGKLLLLAHELRLLLLKLGNLGVSSMETMCILVSQPSVKTFILKMKPCLLLRIGSALEFIQEALLTEHDCGNGLLVKLPRLSLVGCVLIERTIRLNFCICLDLQRIWNWTSWSGCVCDARTIYMTTSQSKHTGIASTADCRITLRQLRRGPSPKVCPLGNLPTPKVVAPPVTFG